MAIMVPVFFYFSCVLWWWVVVQKRGGESAVAPTVGRCSQQDSKNFHIRRILYEKIDSEFPVGFLRSNSILLEIKLIVCYIKSTIGYDLRRRK